MEKLYVNNGRVHGEYCKNKICLVCLGIRKADIINRYLPIISEWEEPHFLTLTVKAVPAKRLKYLIANIQLGFKRIIAKHKKRSQRGKGFALIGIKSLECNFNAQDQTYNPHFHIIVPNKITGEILRNEWIKRAKSRKLIDERAQLNIKIKNPLKCLIEVVKYGSKIFTEPDVAKKNQKGIQRQIYIMALYSIIEAMQGLRLFDRFGFNLPRHEANKGIAKMLANPDEFIYDLNSIDWVDSNSGCLLTGYCPEPKLSFLLESCINIELN
ncbi:MAG: protein rep [Saprospiraceae bacterium]